MPSDETPITVSQLDALLAEVAALRNEVASLRAERDVQLISSNAHDEGARPIPELASRRGFMRAAVGAVGAAGALGVVAISGAQPAAATGGTMQMGLLNDAGTSSTRLSSTATGGPTFGVSNVGGTCYSATGDVGYSATSTTTGVSVIATASGGVFRGGQVGIDAASVNAGGTGVIASGQNYGLDAKGSLAAIHVGTSGGSPTARSDGHAAGEIYHEDLGASGGRLWLCVQAGSPGVWRELACLAATGAMHAVTPHRVYDSRQQEGVLAGGTHRIVAVHDGRDLSGNVDQVDLVPPGATAIAYNLTIIDTVGAGFLAITPAGEPTYSASAINWSTSGTTVANASVVTVDSSRNVTVWAGGAGSSQFIIDVVGYYR